MAREPRRANAAVSSAISEPSPEATSQNAIGPTRAASRSRRFASTVAYHVEAVGAVRKSPPRP
jgi:hypothetical protein